LIIWNAKMKWKVKKEMNKLYIENLTNIEGLELHDISIIRTETDSDNYRFFRSQPEQCFKLSRYPIKVGGVLKYELRLSVLDTYHYVTNISIDIIQLKDSFFKSMKELFDEHIEYVTNTILSKALASVSHSININ